jgi:hypothetical protein
MDSLWILLPGFSAVAAGVLTWFIMQSRMEVKLAQERQREAEEHAAAERTRRQALEMLMGELRAGQRFTSRLPEGRVPLRQIGSGRGRDRVEARRRSEVRGAEPERGATPIVEGEPAPCRILIPLEQPLPRQEIYRSPRRFQEQ